MIELKINSIEDLKEFVKIVRGRDLNIEELKKLASELDTSSIELLEAERKQGESIK